MQVFFSLTKKNHNNRKFVYNWHRTVYAKKTLTKIRALDEQIGAKKSREIFQTKNWLNIQRKVSYCLHLNLTF